MSRKQKVAFFAPIVLIVCMYCIYQLLTQTYTNRVAWYSGFWIYWIAWCGLFSFLIIGKENLCKLIRPRKPDGKVLVLVAFPLIMTVVFRALTGTAYSKPSTLWIVLLISTAFGNGFFEETLWRGVYMNLFPKSIFYRIIWPAIWFGLWHYVPGSLSPNSNTIGLMLGSGLFGIYLGFVAKKTDTIWWCIVAHTLGGIVMVI